MYTSTKGQWEDLNVIITTIKSGARKDNRYFEELGKGNFTTSARKGIQIDRYITHDSRLVR